MKVPQLLDEVRRKVPDGAALGTRWQAGCAVTTQQATYKVAMAARIDTQGLRREQFWCDGVRVEQPVLLRLTCAESECPHAVQVRAQWQAFHSRGMSRAAVEQTSPQPLMAELVVTVGRQQFIARPARFPCFTPCPNGAHPPMTVEKSGYDLFDESHCLGGGVVETNGVRKPRIPTVSAAEAFVLARHLETLAALGAASESSRLGSRPAREGD